MHDTLKTASFHRKRQTQATNTIKQDGEVILIVESLT